MNKQLAGFILSVIGIFLMIGYAIFEGEVYSTVNYIGLSLLGLGFLISIVDIFKYED